LDFQEIKAYAIGVIGLRPIDFGEMRPVEFWAVSKAYTKAENDRLKFLGEMFRGHALRIVNVLIGNKIKKVSKLWRMPWDKEAEVISITKEEREKQIKRLLEIAGNGE